MSLLADWPRVFLWRPPSRTADLHAASPMGRGWEPTSLVIPLMARLTSSSPLSSFPLTQSTVAQAPFFFFFYQKRNDHPNQSFSLSRHFFLSTEFYLLSYIYLPLLLLLLHCIYLLSTAAFRKINKCCEARGWLITF